MAVEIRETSKAQGLIVPLLVSMPTITKCCFPHNFGMPFPTPRREGIHFKVARHIPDYFPFVRDLCGLRWAEGRLVIAYTPLQAD